MLTSSRALEVVAVLLFFLKFFYFFFHLLSFPLNDIHLSHGITFCSDVQLRYIAEVLSLAMCYCFSMCWILIGHIILTHTSYDFISVGSLEALLQVHNSEFDPGLLESSKFLTWQCLKPGGMARMKSALVISKVVWLKWILEGGSDVYTM